MTGSDLLKIAEDACAFEFACAATTGDTSASGAPVGLGAGLAVTLVGRNTLACGGALAAEPLGFGIVFGATSPAPAPVAAPADR